MSPKQISIFFFLCLAGCAGADYSINAGRIYPGMSAEALRYELLTDFVGGDAYLSGCTYVYHSDHDYELRSGPNQKHFYLIKNVREYQGCGGTTGVLAKVFTKRPSNAQILSVLGLSQRSKIRKIEKAPEI